MSDLAEALVGLGVDVTLFAPPGSRTSARLVPTIPAPLSDLPPEPAITGLFDPGHDPRVWEQLHIARSLAAAEELDLDVVHSHLHVHALVFAPFLRVPLVSTLHGSAWNRAHHPVLEAFAERPFVSISDAERRFLPVLRYVATVHNGIDTGSRPQGDGEGGFLLFAGRLAPEKAPELAIEVARRSGRRLVLAGPVDRAHPGFFEEEVIPRLGGDVEYVGPVEREELASLYARAIATLVPLRWDEPFGLVVAESMAAGTPVIAWRRGAMPELVGDGETGFVVESVDEAVAAVGRIGGIYRRRCREEAVSRFDATVMAKGYLAVYEQTAQTMASRISSRS